LTMRIVRALHLRTAARTFAFDTQMPSTSWRPRPHPWRTGMTELLGLLKWGVRHTLC
jgi:hypothetical protein